jgi:hypothetical protein
MAYTPKQLFSYIAAQMKTTPESLLNAYENIPMVKNKLDRCIDDINSRRTENGLEPLIISEKLLAESEN